MHAHQMHYTVCASRPTTALSVRKPLHLKNPGCCGPGLDAPQTVADPGMPHRMSNSLHHQMYLCVQPCPALFCFSGLRADMRHGPQVGVNASADKVLDQLIASDTANAFNISLQDVNVTSIAQASPHIPLCSRCTVLGFCWADRQNCSASGRLHERVAIGASSQQSE